MLWLTAFLSHGNEIVNAAVVAATMFPNGRISSLTSCYSRIPKSISKNFVQIILLIKYLKMCCEWSLYTSQLVVYVQPHMGDVSSRTFWISSFLNTYRMECRRLPHLGRWFFQQTDFRGFFNNLHIWKTISTIPNIWIELCPCNSWQTPHQTIIGLKMHSSASPI